MDRGIHSDRPGKGMCPRQVRRPPDVVSEQSVTSLLLLLEDLGFALPVDQIQFVGDF